MERLDTSGSQGYDIDIRRYDKGLRYTIFHEFNEVKCVYTNFTTKMPLIDLSNFKYTGNSTINKIPCYEFDSPPNSLYSEYFQNADNGIPVRLETGGPSDEVLDFFMFDEVAPPASAFDASIVAPGVTCIYQPNDDMFGFVRMAWLDAPNVKRFKYYSPPLMTQSNVTGPLACESGEASWYSCDGRGACAACTPSDLYAAHKTLPCGTAATVTDTANGRSVKVKIEDRGPYVAGRIIDMNHAPAVDLDMISAGVVPARVCS